MIRPASPRSHGLIIALDKDMERSTKPLSLDPEVDQPEPRSARGWPLPSQKTGQAAAIATDLGAKFAAPSPSRDRDPAPVTAIESEWARSELEQITGLVDSLARHVRILNEGVDGRMEGRAQVMRVSRREAATIANQLADLLVENEIRSGSFEFKAEPVNLAPILDNAIRKMRAPAAYKGVRFIADMEDLEPIQGSASLLERAFEALLRWAVRYAGHESTIVIGTSSGSLGTDVLISMGHEGIAKELFSQLLYGKPSGAPLPADDPGLIEPELVAAKHILQTHGARPIYQPGGAEGFTIKISFPDMSTPTKPAMRSDQVLIIEDDEDSALLMSQALERIGLHTIGAKNGFSGLSRALRGGVGLIVLDLMLPGLDGYEVCHRLKTSPNTKHLPVIMVSAKAGVQDRAIGLRVGADAYLTKPLDLQTFLNTAKELILARTRNG